MAKLSLIPDWLRELFGMETEGERLSREAGGDNYTLDGPGIEEGPETCPIWWCRRDRDHLGSHWPAEGIPPARFTK